ncbi:MAG: replication initiation protein [Candidatus Marinimicrobia bacterium]|nr:replication initiation protein [Candidatus Neomarinimicrobiota bacterium]MBT3633102.1 replication initiation protein [Candidatus Neomarinimicrobiota bacterium]MBT3682297.1 replication initiation protein [Candidatus Neomarinimicrobiota bacterium]MBT3758702.1 replication initiation protein [Candidatus Neomarinimicrobiota bacterium]MBT3895424.1 replication initiation protein [Candidatus Neomarinimicrobiota bacterium]
MLLIIPLFSLIYCQTENTSISYGSPLSGHMDNGVKLPYKGENFVPYSTLGFLLGRTYVNSRVRDIIVETYKIQQTKSPDVIFMYGETGFENGGPFKPHKTHMNGTSVDFMVPIINKDEESIPLPTSVFNKFGYSIEFTLDGKFKNYEIDFESMASHLKSLHQISVSMGYGIQLVIFDPKMRHHLINTVDGEYLKNNLKFNTKRVWVRHDEHYHVNFDIPTE